MELSWFPSTPRAARLARQRVASTCQDLNDDDTFVATLLTSELVTNAYLHPRTDQMSGEAGIFMHVLRVGDRLRVEIFDDDAAPLTRAHLLALSEEPGCGLGLVAKLSSSWGSSPVLGHGKVVWFELRATPGPIREPA